MSKRRPPRSSRGRRGFTLLELLVSVTILSLLLVILLSMVDTATKLWRTNENRVDAYREARAAINLIASDLGGAYASSDPNLFFTQKNTDLEIAAAETTPGLNGSLFFLAALPTEAQGGNATTNKGDLCGIGYFLAYDNTSILPTSKADKSLNLYRYFQGSDATFAALRSGTGLRKLIQDVAPTTGPTGNAEVIAKNITGFEVNAYSTSNNSTTGLADFDKSSTTPVPDVVEIRLKALNNDTARRLKGSESAWKTPNNPITKAEERTFVVRVRLPGAATVKTPPSASPSPTP